jgi:glycosyltransferase involved in cell wall biosynthesis
MLESVALVGDVDFVGYSIDPAPDGLLSESMLTDMGELCRTVRICQHPPWRGVGKRQKLNLLQRYFISPTPILYADFPCEPLLTMLEPLARNADMIWVERLYAAHWLRQHGEKTIVDVDDLDSVKQERQLVLQPPSLLRLGQSVQTRKLAREERMAASKFARLAVCSSQDREFWQENERNRVWVVPNGADNRLFDYPRELKVANRLVFVGTMGYPPNVDAVKYFCAEILPRITRAVPDVSFWIVGKSPSDDVLELDDGERIRVWANVPDVAPYVQTATLSVVPLRVGGGTRLKILESLALGTPVVSTTIGAEGLDLVNERDLLLADSPDDFAHAVVDLLSQHDRLQAMAEAGLQAVKTNYSWTGIRGQVAEHLRGWFKDRQQMHD